MLGVICANAGFFSCRRAGRGRGNFPFAPSMSERRDSSGFQYLMTNGTFFMFSAFSLASRFAVDNPTGRSMSFRGNGFRLRIAAGGTRISFYSSVFTSGFGGNYAFTPIVSFCRDFNVSGIITTTARIVSLMTFFRTSCVFCIVVNNVVSEGGNFNVSGIVATIAGIISLVTYFRTSCFFCYVVNNVVSKGGNFNVSGIIATAARIISLVTFFRTSCGFCVMVNNVVSEGGDSFRFFMLGVISANSGFLAYRRTGRGCGNRPLAPSVSEFVCSLYVCFGLSLESGISKRSDVSSKFVGFARLRLRYGCRYRRGFYFFMSIIVFAYSFRGTRRVIARPNVSRLAPSMSEFVCGLYVCFGLSLESGISKRSDVSSKFVGFARLRLRYGCRYRRGFYFFMSIIVFAYSFRGTRRVIARPNVSRITPIVSFCGDFNVSGIIATAARIVSVPAYLRTSCVFCVVMNNVVSEGGNFNVSGIVATAARIVSVPAFFRTSCGFCVMVNNVVSEFSYSLLDTA